MLRAGRVCTGGAPQRIFAGAAIWFLATLAFPAAAQFTDWSTPQNLGPSVNTAYADSCVAISKNKLTLFFSSNRQTGNAASMNRDLYVSKRDSTDADWGPPVPLDAINTGDWESCPALSVDEHQLYFTSNRPGGCGAEDIWVAHRQDIHNDVDWEPPVHLGCAADGFLNTPGRDLMPTLFETETGGIVMYFSTIRPGTSYWDIYQSEMRDDGTFGPPSPVTELNSATYNSSPTVRRDGLEIIFSSDRPGGSGNSSSLDFWSATRATTSDPWSMPVFVPSLGNPALMQGRIALSWDGLELYFTSTRPGGLGGAATPL